jgi:hypothetical protein
MADYSPQQRFEPRARLAAATSSRAQIEELCTETAPEVLLAFAHNPHLGERDLLRLLERKDLPAEVVRELASHPEARRNYTIKLALARHPRTPRLVCLPILKFLYVFDLLRVAQTPAVPFDIKMAAEEAILRKLQGMPTGEKITLARRATGRVAAALLISTDAELIEAALDNPYVSESHLFKILALQNLPPIVVEQIARHERWSHYYHLRLALIRNPLTPLARVLSFLPNMTAGDLRDICHDPRMPEPVRKYVLAHSAARLRQQGGNRPAG